LSPTDKGRAEIRRGTFIDEATSDTDAAAVVAMSSVIDQLASQIAVTLEPDAVRGNRSAITPKS
jgi:hypothetical protein